MSNKNTELELLKHAAQEGDKSAYQELIDIYVPIVLMFTTQFAESPDQALSLTNTIFAEAWDWLDKWDEETGFLTIILRTAVLLCIDNDKPYLHRQSPAIYLKPDIIIPTQLENEAIQLDQYSLTSIYAALDTLPPNMKAMVLIRILTDLPYKEIATIMNMDISDINNGIRHGMSTMCERLSWAIPANER